MTIISSTCIFQDCNAATAQKLVWPLVWLFRDSSRYGDSLESTGGKLFIIAAQQPRPTTTTGGAAATTTSRTARIPKLFHIDQSPTNASYAVCISGYRGEAILHDKMFRHFRDFILTPDTDLFLFIETPNVIVSHNGSLSTDFDISRLKQLYGPWLRSFVVTDGRDLREEEQFLHVHGQRSSTAVAGWNGILQNLYKQAKCNSNLIQPYELARGKPFDAVLKTRPEFYVKMPVDLSPAKDDPNSLYTVVWFAPYDRADGLAPQTPPQTQFSIDSVPDIMYFGSSKVMRTVSQAVYGGLAALEFYRYEASFPESILKYVLADAFRINTKSTSPLVADITRKWMTDDDEWV